MKEEKTCLTDGSPVTENHKEIDPATGMQKGYVVLTPEEREKGYVRPVRHSYQHLISNDRGCGSITVISNAIAETYARDPQFYGGTFCCHCKDHFPVGEFVWSGTNEKVGS